MKKNILISALILGFTSASITGCSDSGRDELMRTETLTTYVNAKWRTILNSVIPEETYTISFCDCIEDAEAYLVNQSASAVLGSCPDSPATSCEDDYPNSYEVVVINEIKGSEIRRTSDGSKHEWAVYIKDDSLKQVHFNDVTESLDRGVQALISALKEKKEIQDSWSQAANAE